MSKEKPIYENHINLWQATIEMHQMQLQRCVPSLEPKYKALRDAAGNVKEAIEAYKALNEQL